MKTFDFTVSDFFIEVPFASIRANFALKSSSNGSFGKVSDYFVTSNISRFLPISASFKFSYLFNFSNTVSNYSFACAYSSITLVPNRFTLSTGVTFFFPNIANKFTTGFSYYCCGMADA